MYLCVVDHVFVCFNLCKMSSLSTSCICVLLVMYLCVLISARCRLYQRHVFVCYVMYLCVRGIDFVSTIFIFDFEIEIVPIVWYDLFSI